MKSNALTLTIMKSNALTLTIIIRLAQLLEVSLDYLLLGEDSQKVPEFQVNNKRLQELCKQADKLDQGDQDVVCKFLDMAVRQSQMKQIVAG